MKRPLVWCAAAFSLGTAVTLSFSPFYILVIIGCILFTAYAYKRLSFLILIPVFFAGMLPIHIYNHKYVEPIQQYDNRTLLLDFEIKDAFDTRSSGGFYKYAIDAGLADGYAFDFSGELYSMQRYNEGDLVKAPCKIYPLSDSDPMMYYNINRGCHFSAFSESGRVTGTAEVSVIGKIKAFRKSVIARLDQNSDPKAFGFLSAILTGDKQHLSEYRTETFRKTGLSHLMAVSGLHVSLLLGVLLIILGLLRIKGITANIICTIFLLFIIPFMNFSPSAIRAVIMNLVLLWSFTVKKDADSLSALSLAAIILLIFRPYSLKDLSFTLSFTATCGLILLSPVIQSGLNKLTKRDFPSLSAVLAVHIFLIPANIYYFGSFTLSSVFANLLFVPVFPVILITLIITLISGGYVPFLTEFLNTITGIFLGAVEAVSRLPLSRCEIKIEEPLVFLMIITLAISVAFRQKMRLMFLAVSALVFVSIIVKSFEFF